MLPLLFSLVVVGAGDYIPPPQEAPEWAYYQCMVDHSKRYGRKTSRAEEAILAAGAACRPVRKELLTQLYRDAHDSDSQGRKHASERLLHRIDKQLYPFFVKAALDAR